MLRHRTPPSIYDLAWHDLDFQKCFLPLSFFTLPSYYEMYCIVSLWLTQQIGHGKNKAVVLDLTLRRCRQVCLHLAIGPDKYNAIATSRCPRCVKALPVLLMLRLSNHASRFLQMHTPTHKHKLSYLFIKLAYIYSLIHSHTHSIGTEAYFKIQIFCDLDLVL